jgi:hypothetical protein
MRFARLPGDPAALILLVSNLIPLAGVWWWGWDVFQILVLFWMQTVLTVVFTLLHVHKLPAGTLGNVTVNGVERPATHRDLLVIIGGVGHVFCAAHLLFLWVMFSGDWNRTIRGPASFFHHMVMASGAWVALLVGALGGIVGYLLTPPRSRFLRWIGFSERKNDEELGAVLLGLFKRVALMQVAIIFGAMLANSYGSMAPLMILIGLKTLADLGGGKPLTGGHASIDVKP